MSSDDVDAARFGRSMLTTEAKTETDADGRTVTVRLVPWDTVQEVSDGRGRYTETFVRGGLRAPGGPIPVYVEREHDGPVVGVLEDELDDRPDGLYGRIRLSRSSHGTDTLADIEEKILRYVSVDFYDTPVAPGTDHVVRSAAVLRRVAFTLLPQHDAPVLSVRSHTPHTKEVDPEMTSNETPADIDAETAADEPDAVEPAPVLSSRSVPVIRPAAPVEPVTGPRFDSFGHYVRAVALGTVDVADRDTFQRALADVTSVQTPGLLREGWINDVIDIGRTLAPTVNNWRRRPLPATEWSVSQPVVGTRPTVAKQTAEKTAIESTAPTIDVAQWPINTYAGGNDVSVQALTRGTPDLMDELMRLYRRELAHTVNAAAVAALNAAAAEGVSGNAALTYTDAAGFDGLIINASAAFLASLRRPADLMALSVELWQDLAAARDDAGRPLYPTVNPMNASGQITGQTIDGQIVAVPWYVEPDLGAGKKAVVGVSDAFLSQLGPVNTMSVDVPSKLGRDVAIYQEAAFGATDPAGLIQIVTA